MGGGSGWGVRVDAIEELKFLGKCTEKKMGGRRGEGCGGGVGLVGGQGGCERRIEVFVKIQNFFFFFFFLGGGGRGFWVWGSGWM